MDEVKNNSRYLIVGLGNPGKKYQNNRHNVGFIFLDYLVEKLKIENLIQDFEQKWKKDSLFQSELIKTILFNKEYILLKPQTYMNMSGFAVRKVSKSYNISTSEIIIVHDDLDMPLGRYKIHFANGPKLHNGLESIKRHLGTKDFWRIRIGVDNRQKTGWVDGEAYVLQDFLPEEKEILKKEVFENVIERLKKNRSQLKGWI